METDAETKLLAYLGSGRTKGISLKGNPRTVVQLLGREVQWLCPISKDFLAISPHFFPSLLPQAGVGPQLDSLQNWTHRGVSNRL